MLEKFKLDGKYAVITGAAGLLGVEHALALLESGANVVLTDIDSVGLNKAYQIIESQYDSVRVKKIEMDVTQPDCIKNVINSLSKNKITIDILINNAALDAKVNNGIVGANNSRLEHFSLESWNQEISVGLTGAFLCAKYFGSLMAESGKGGVILNIASDLSICSPDQRLYKINGVQNKSQPVKPVTYSVIKTGIIGLTRYLSTYWVEEGVRCNALSPGGVDNSQGDEFIKKLNALIPLGRMAKKDEYRSAVQFLCSDASAYMNGQNIVIDGGRSVW